MFQRTIPTVTVSVLLLVSSAAAEDARDCASSDPDVAIHGCTAIIRAATSPSPALAGPYINRGAAYASKKNYDLAIADYTKAIELAPKLARAYELRGVAYTDKGDYQRGVADVTMAVELAPKKPASVVKPAAASATPPKAAAKATPTKAPAPKAAPKAPAPKVAAPSSPPAAALPSIEGSENGEAPWAFHARRVMPNQ